MNLFDTNVLLDIATTAVAGGKLYVTNCACNESPFPSRITVYPSSASGDAVPERTIEGPHTGLKAPGPIAVDPAGNIIVGNQSSITVFGPNATGDATPIVTIAGPATGVHYPSSLSVDSDGYIVEADQFSQFVFAPGANGNVAPIITTSLRGVVVVH